MKRSGIAAGVMATLMVSTTVFAQSMSPLQVRSTAFRFIELPASISSNVSWISADLPFPTLNQESQVIRTGGDMSWTSGSPLVLIAGGVQTRPWIAGYNSGLVDMSLQFSTCDQGSEITYTDALNDHFTWFLVADWAAQQTGNITITVSTGDINGVPTDQTKTFTSSEIASAPLINVKAVMIDPNMDNIVSMVGSCMRDVYDSRMGSLGNLSALVLGNKNGASVRGVSMFNRQNYFQPMEVPECVVKGSEWANDLHKLIALIRTDQVSGATSWEQFTTYENDDLQNPGKWSQFHIQDLWGKTFVPVVLR